MSDRLTNWQYELLLDREAQANDNTIKKIKLPRDGHITQIDLEARCTNGATSNRGYSGTGERIEDAIDKIEIIANGSKVLMSVTSIDDLIAEAVRITGKIPRREVTEAASAVQIVTVPIFMGRYPDDRLVCLPNGDSEGKSFWDNLEMHISYSPTIAATAFATGTFALTVNVKKLVDGSPAESKFIKMFKKKWDYTTVASGDEPKTLTYGNNMFLRALQIYEYEAGVVEGVDITHLELKLHPKGGSMLQYGKWRWEQLQDHNAAVYNLGESEYEGRAFCADTAVISTRVPNIKRGLTESQIYALAAGDIRKTAVEAITGDQLTLGSWTHATDIAAAAANVTNHPVYWTVKTDTISRYAYIDFDETRALIDLLDTGKLSDLTLVITNGGAGGTVRINEEIIMTAKQFRAG